MHKRLLLTLIGSALLVLSACTSQPVQPAGAAQASAKPGKLTIGVQATKPDETRAAWQPLVSGIGQKHGITTELLTASQTDTVKALRDGKLDIVWLSSNVAIDAVVDAGAQAFALYYNVNGTNQRPSRR